MSAELKADVELLTAYSSEFAGADYQPVYDWMADGACLKKDVLPVIRLWTGRKTDIYSLRFFTRYVLQARDARLKAMLPPEKVPDHVKAVRIAFLTRWVSRCLPQETTWLEAYERKNGRVDSG